MENSDIKSLSLMNEYTQRADLGNFLAKLESRLQALEGGEGGGDLSALQQKVSELEEKVTTLEGKVTPLEGLDGKVTTLEETVNSNGEKLTTVEETANQNKSDISDANGKITALEGRVEALEGAGA